MTWRGAHGFIGGKEAPAEGVRARKQPAAQAEEQTLAGSLHSWPGGPTRVDTGWSHRHEGPCCSTWTSSRPVCAVPPSLGSTCRMPRTRPSWRALRPWPKHSAPLRAPEGSVPQHSTLTRGRLLEWKRGGHLATRLSSQGGQGLQARPGPQSGCHCPVLFLPCHGCLHSPRIQSVSLVGWLPTELAISGKDAKHSPRLSGRASPEALTMAGLP